MSFKPINRNGILQDLHTLSNIKVGYWFNPTILSHTRPIRVNRCRKAFPALLKVRFMGASRSCSNGLRTCDFTRRFSPTPVPPFYETFTGNLGSIYREFIMDWILPIHYTRCLEASISGIISGGVKYIYLLPTGS